MEGKDSRNLGRKWLLLQSIVKNMITYAHGDLKLRDQGLLDLLIQGWEQGVTS